MQLEQPKINLRDCPTILCEKCGGMYFKETLVLKKVSRLQGAANDTDVPIPVFRCEDCGHVNEGFNPFEDKKIETNE